ncbi:TlpA disulfide reductase family protein [Litoreibacter albidus]|uniref:Thiol-disulfide isomerase or thioredoxin n=1 Tax=Litoreibacter albidus TaxID=670155 RepID=A0A1H2V6P9_9RHOB|nr:TlpA disulfide reductase family protein [Litoreibacter albidus]SDW63991.1 Thiol-disulfide isomerase or thioredoxin [Litoreibacter albidus]
MRFLKLLVLYAGLASGANPAVAGTDALFTMAEGDLASLQLHGEPRAVPTTPVTDANGKAVDLSDYHGKYVLLNFWALWCAPCVKEMPALDRLDAELGGADFEVVTVATGRNARPAVDKFFTEKNINNLPKLFDPKMKLMRDIGGAGLPLTVLIGPDGREVARFSGDAEWDSPAALAMLRGWMS